MTIFTVATSVLPLKKFFSPHAQSLEHVKNTLRSSPLRSDAVLLAFVVLHLVKIARRIFFRAPLFCKFARLKINTIAK
jgi:hypothetical protein